MISLLAPKAGRAENSSVVASRLAPACMRDVLGMVIKPSCQYANSMAYGEWRNGRLLRIERGGIASVVCSIRSLKGLTPCLLNDVEGTAQARPSHTPRDRIFRTKGADAWREAGQAPAQQPPGLRRYTLFLVDEVSAAVLLPAGFVRLGAERLLLPIADGLDAARIHTGRDHGILDRVGATIAEGQVVLGRAAFVAMSLNRELDI